MNKHTFGLSENLASAGCYLFGFISGIIFFVAEKENKAIRFHALQAIVWFGALQIISSIFSIIFGHGNIFARAVDFVMLISWAYSIFNAYSGRLVKLPFVGDAAWNQVNK